MPISARTPRSAGPARRLRWRLESALFALATGTLSRVGPSTRMAVGSSLGGAFWALSARHRRTAARNITLALGGERSARDIARLARQSMRHFGRETVDALGFLSETAGRDVLAEGLDHLARASAKGRGVIGVSGHFGHWELLRLVAARHGWPSTTIVRPLENHRLDRQVSALRESGGNQVVAKRGALGVAAALLRRGEMVTMLIDQRPAREGVPVTLFGQTAFAAASVAVLALRTGAPILPGFGYLDASGAWRVTLEEEIAVNRTGDADQDVRRIMQDCTAVLERWIRRHPEQWLWTHAKFQ